MRPRLDHVASGVLDVDDAISRDADAACEAMMAAAVGAVSRGNSSEHLPIPRQRRGRTTGQRSNFSVRSGRV
jgi:hypothetical protein